MRQKNGVAVTNRNQTAMRAGNPSSVREGIEVGTEAIDLEGTTAQLVRATTGGARHGISLVGVMR